MPISTILQPFFSARFIKFGIVGASGVVVNLLALWVFQQLGIRSSFASALAIQVSILSNFLINDGWTFRDRRVGNIVARATRFQLVSLVGAGVQWVVFLLANLMWLRLLWGSDAFEAYQAGRVGFIDQWVMGPVVDPPSIGLWIYVSQLCGIAVAMGWNFLANVKWTWRR